MGSTQPRNLLYLISVSLLFTLCPSASDGQIRLAGWGSTRCSGRVEIYHNSIWGTACDDGWDLNDAEVVCRQLGCGTALGAPPLAHFGEGTGQIWLNKVDCSGSERSLTECQHKGFGTHNCYHSEDAGVICSGVPIRLAGSTRCSGRVEIYYNTWGTVCYDSWDLNDAKVVCRQLGCGTALRASASAQFGQGTGRIWLDDVDCSGSESSITECQHAGFGQHDCSRSEDAGVVCSGVPVRLVGPTLCSGRVEIYYKNTWGTVCNGGWDLNDATVVCRELGCGTAEYALKSPRFGEKNNQTWLGDVDCSGRERSLTECQHRGFGHHSCSHSGEAGLICSAILPKPSIYINPADVVDWGQDVGITCSISIQTQQLLHGRFTLNQTSGSFSQNQTLSTNSATFSILKVDFYNEGLYQCQFSQHVSSPLSDPVNLSVTVQQPSISLTSPNRGLVWSPEGAEVTRGYSFVITCSSSHYPTGVFFLVFSGSNITKSEPAVNHSASFNFPVAEFGHQGNYSCVHEVAWSTRKYTSPMTAPISVVIKKPLLLLVSSVPGGGLLLLLLVLVAVCLVLRRRRRAKQAGALVQTQLTVTNHDEEDDRGDEEEGDYVNVEPMDTMGQTARAGGEAEADSDDHNYEEEEIADNYTDTTEFFVDIKDSREEQVDEKETSDDEEDYVNVTQPYIEQVVDIYGEDDDIYQNM